MIAYLSEWLKKIILLVLIASFIDLFLPSSAIQRYARMTIGLLIILAMLSPLLALFNLDRIKENISFQSLGLINNSGKNNSFEEIQREAKKMQVEQYDAIFDQFSNNLSKEITTSIEQKYEIKSEVEVLLTMNKENEPRIDKILVYLIGGIHKKDNKDNLLDHSEIIETIPTVEVQLSRNDIEKAIPISDEYIQEKIQPIQEYLLDIYQLSKEQVEIRSQKGRSNNGS